MLSYISDNVVCMRLIWWHNDLLTIKYQFKFSDNNRIYILKTPGQNRNWTNFRLILKTYSLQKNNKIGKFSCDTPKKKKKKWRKAVQFSDILVIHVMMQDVRVNINTMRCTHNFLMWLWLPCDYDLLWYQRNRCVHINCLTKKSE